MCVRARVCACARGRANVSADVRLRARARVRVRMRVFGSPGIGRRARLESDAALALNRTPRSP